MAMALPFDGAREIRSSRREPAGLVKLLIIRQIRFRDDSEQLPLLADGGDIVKLIAHKPGQANDEHPTETPFAFVQQMLERDESCFLQGCLMEQIAASVAGKRQFGKNEYLDGLLFGLVDQIKQTLGVVGAIRDAQARKCRRDANETVLEHNRPGKRKPAEYRYDS